MLMYTLLVKNEHNEEVYKAVKRVYNKDVDGSKVKFAINSLVRGPKQEERQKACLYRNSFRF